MTRSSLIGIVAAVVGAALLFFGWRASTAPVEQVSDALTGRFTRNTMPYGVGGVAALAGGLALILRGAARG